MSDNVNYTKENNKNKNYMKPTTITWWPRKIVLLLWLLVNMRKQNINKNFR